LPTSNLSSVTAVILAGGLGKRLRPVITKKPKSLAEINGRPFLYYLLDQLNAKKINKVVISTGYMAEKIEKEIGLKYKSLNIVFCKESSPAGTGGGLKNTEKVINTDLCLIMNGDSYVEYDASNLFLYHNKLNSTMTMVTRESKDISRFGVVKTNQKSKIIDFVEKGAESGKGLINAGIYLIKKSLLKKIPTRIPYSLELDFFPSLIGKEIYSFKTKGDFIDIGTPKSYEKAKYFNWTNKSKVSK